MVKVIKTSQNIYSWGVGRWKVEKTEVKGLRERWILLESHFTDFEIPGHLLDCLSIGKFWLNTSLQRFTHLQWKSITFIKFTHFIPSAVWINPSVNNISNHPLKIWISQRCGILPLKLTVFAQFLSSLVPEGGRVSGGHGRTGKGQFRSVCGPPSCTSRWAESVSWPLDHIPKHGEIIYGPLIF